MKAESTQHRWLPGGVKRQHTAQMVFPYAFCTTLITVSVHGLSILSPSTRIMPELCYAADLCSDFFCEVVKFTSDGLDLLFSKGTLLLYATVDIYMNTWWMIRLTETPLCSKTNTQGLSKWYITCTILKLLFLQQYSSAHPPPLPQYLKSLVCDRCKKWQWSCSSCCSFSTESMR